VVMIGHGVIRLIGVAIGAMTGAKMAVHQRAVRQRGVRQPIQPAPASRLMASAVNHGHMPSGQTPIVVHSVTHLKDKIIGHGVMRPIDVMIGVMIGRGAMAFKNAMVLKNVIAGLKGVMMHLAATGLQAVTKSRDGIQSRPLVRNQHAVKSLLAASPLSTNGLISVTSQQHRNPHLIAANLQTAPRHQHQNLAKSAHHAAAKAPPLKVVRAH
ncbi:MAG: hypothetical protein ACO34H_10325, partial [Candidatus Puniceispirillaceae bacterium]